MADFEAVAKLHDVPEDGVKPVIVKGEPVGLYRVGDEVYAAHDYCTHEEAELSEGDFDPDDLEVECPLHGSRFNVATGDVHILPAIKPLATYEVKIEDGLILVDPKKGNEE